MGFSSPQPAHAAALIKLLADTQDVYARLLAAMEQYIAVDPEADPDLAKVRDHQTSQLMREADAELQLLRKTIEPWSQRRKNYPADLGEKVDQFLELIEKCLVGILSQIQHRIGHLNTRKMALQDAIGQLGQQRRGLQGYYQKSPPSRFLDKKA